MNILDKRLVAALLAVAFCDGNVICLCWLMSDSDAGVPETFLWISTLISQLRALLILKINT